MPTNSRVMVGVADYTGSEVNGLKIGQMVQRHGPGNEPVYQSECSICKSRSTATQRDLRNASARCRAAGCGKIPVSDKTRATELARQVKEREAEAQRLRDEASAARMESETAGYKKVNNRPPVSDDPGPLTERQRISLRAHREEQEAAQRAERERLEAPVKEAQAKLLATHRELAKVERERLEATVKDPDAYADPALNGQRMTEAEADQFNRTEFQRFRAANPELYVTGELVDHLGRYFAKNGLHLISAPMLDRAVSRFRDAGLLPERPAPQPMIKRIETPARVPVPKAQDIETGWDELTGEELTLTRRQVNALSAEQYKRFARLTKDKLGLPNVGPGPKGLRSI